MNILFLVSSEGCYGIENMLVTLARNLRRYGCRCIVTVFRDSRLPHTEVAEAASKAGLEVEVIPCSGRFDWNVVRQLRKLIAEYKVDIIHPHGYKADFYAYAATWGNPVALLATAHNWPSKRAHMRLYAWLDRFILRYFHRVVVVSDTVAQRLRRAGVSPEKLFTVGNGVDLEMFAAARPAVDLKRASTGETIGFVGRLVPDKGGETLLHAAQRVLKHHPETTFVFVGDGPCRSDWYELTKQLGIEKQVLFTGAREDMPETYASLDIVVLPSLVESMPMCVLEGMAAGKAVIATRVGMIPELIADGANGLLLERGSIDDLVNAVVRLVRDPSLRRQLGKNGQEYISKFYSAEAMARNYLTHYCQVLANLKRTPLPSAA